MRVVLRTIGTASLAAIPFVVLPESVLASIHAGLGLGPLPEGPVVGYLARSLSAFYAITGGLLWIVSTDLRRHRPILLYLAGAFVLLGVALVGIDHVEGLPVWWRVWEGPFVTALGLVLSVLGRRIPGDRDC